MEMVWEGTGASLLHKGYIPGPCMSLLLPNHPPVPLPAFLPGGGRVEPKTPMAHVGQSPSRGAQASLKREGLHRAGSRTPAGSRSGEVGMQALPPCMEGPTHPGGSQCCDPEHVGP